MAETPYPDLPELEKLRALLEIAESRARRERLALEISAKRAHNEFCYFQLSSSILALKNEFNRSWDTFHTELKPTCSVDMLKSIALRRKQPSLNLYNNLCSSLTNLAIRHGYSQPSLPTPEDLK